MVNDVISFPGLGLQFNPPRIAFVIFGRGIYWYGIILAVAFLTAALYALKRSPKFGITSDDLTDVLIFATPAAIICARLYYVIFEWDKYADNPVSALYIWDGGIAIYGAVIGALVAVLIVTTVKHINALAVMDIGAIGLLIGQAIGRWGNFVNREAFGTVTNLPWRMEIYDRMEGIRHAVHPTFLYESLWNVLGFILLHKISKRRKYNGQIFLMYVAWYGFGRGLIEGLRTDSLYLTSTLRVSQLLGFLSCLIAIILLFYNFIFKSHDPSKLVDLTAEAPEADTPATDTPSSDAAKADPGAVSTGESPDAPPEEGPEETAQPSGGAHEEPEKPETDAGGEAKEEGTDAGDHH